MTAFLDINLSELRHNFSGSHGKTVKPTFADKWWRVESQISVGKGLWFRVVLIVEG